MFFFLLLFLFEPNKITDYLILSGGWLDLIFAGTNISLILNRISFLIFTNIYCTYIVNNAFNLAKKMSGFLLHGIYLGIKTLHFAKENKILILYPPYATVSISCNHLTELFGPLEKWCLLHKKYGWEKNPGKLMAIYDLSLILNAGLKSLFL